MRVSAKIVPILAIVGVLAAGCSSSTGGTGGTASPSKSPSTSASSSTSASATTSSSASATTGSTGTPSAATLRSVVLQQSDLPTGYTGTAATPEAKQDSTDQQIASCIGRKDTSDADQVQQVQSDDFKMGQITVSSNASSYKTAADVSNQVALIKAPKAQSCLETYFRTEIAKSLPSSAKIDKATITLDNSSNPTPNIVGSVRGAVTVSAQGQTISVYIGVVFITGRQLTAEVNVTSIGAEISPSLENQVAQAVAKRAASA